MKALIIGGNRFLGHELARHLVAAGHAVTLFNRGTLKDALGERVERLHCDRTTGDFERLLEGRPLRGGVEPPEDAFDRGQWDYGVKKRGFEDELARALLPRAPAAGAAAGVRATRQRTAAGR